jgi:type IV pilus assembly protein PilM
VNLTAKLPLKFPLKFPTKLPALPLPRQYSPVGVDLGTRQVKLVQLARRPGGDDWHAATCAAFPRAAPGQALDAAEASRLVEVMNRQGFRGRDVVVALAPERLMESMLELPPRAPGVPLEQIARMELSRVHQRDPATFEFAQWEVPPPARASRATHVMAVACAHDAATAVLDVLEGQGLLVRAIDAEQCAIARACALLPDTGKGGMTALLDLGFNAARLAILHCGVIIYSRAIEEAGQRSLCDDLRRELEIDSETVEHMLGKGFFLSPAEGGCTSDEARTLLVGHFDALIKEINVAFSYASHQYPEAPLSRLMLLGGGAEVPGVGDYLGAVLGMPSEVARPALLVPGGHAAEPWDSPALVAALGMALYRKGASS